MPVIAIKKTRRPKEHPNKKAAINHILATGRDINDYDFLYVYTEQRTAFSREYYRNAHRKAALESYHRNKTTTRPVGRPRKDNGHTVS